MKQFVSKTVNRDNLNAELNAASEQGWSVHKLLIDQGLVTIVWEKESLIPPRPTPTPSNGRPAALPVSSYGEPTIHWLDREDIIFVVGLVLFSFIFGIIFYVCKNS